MAGSSFFLLLDDIAALLDDVSVMSKVAAQKTAGVLGDDLALNAQQVAGVDADRELPVVWAVAKGSFKNKAILVPLALLISAIVPWLIMPLLMVGGAYLCYEGVEKIWHNLHHPSREEQAEQTAEHQQHLAALLDPNADVVAIEKEKIQGAIRTDFVLSAEIITLALGIVANAPFSQQVAVLCIIGVAMTVGVYGFVAAIVKLDDVGLHFTQLTGRNLGHSLLRSIGRGLLWGAPWLMKTLSFVGTIAMFLVGGGIIAHGVPALHHGIEALSASASALGSVVPILADGLIGVVAGAIVLGLVGVMQKIRK